MISNNINKDNFFLINKVKQNEEFYISGKGVLIKNNEGKNCIDMSCADGFLPIGYCNPIVTKTISKNAKKLLYSPNTYYSTIKGIVAGSICRAAKMDKIVFAENYKESTELAIRVARRCYPDNPQKHKIVIIGDLSLVGTAPKSVLTKAVIKTSYGKELPGGYKYAKFNDIDSVRTALNDKTVCAVIVKTVQAYSGVFAKATPQFMQALREITDANDQLLIIDEHETAGRFGKFMSYQAFNIHPDIVALGKNLSNGLPFGAVCCERSIAEFFDSTGLDYQFRSNQLVCAVVNSVVEYMASPKFEKSSKSLFLNASKGIEKIKKFNTVVRQISRTGSFVHIEFNSAFSPKTISDTFKSCNVLATFPSENDCILSLSITQSGGDVNKCFAAIAKVCQLLESKL